MEKKDGLTAPQALGGERYLGRGEDGIRPEDDLAIEPNIRLDGGRVEAEARELVSELQRQDTRN